MTPWRAARFAVVDIETTGLDPAVDEVLSVAVVPVEHGRIRVGDALYRALRADREPTVDTIVVHGIRPVDVRRGSAPDEVWDDVAAALAGRTPVVHVQWVERTFLSPVLRSHGSEFPRAVVDTDVLFRRHLHRAGLATPATHASLGDAARRFGLPVHRPHHASGDALTTAQLFLALATCFTSERDATVDELTGARVHAWWERAFDAPLRRADGGG